MKALSVRQPWANMIAVGYKYMETRTWKTTHRGPLLIVSSNEVGRSIEGWQLGPLGAMICVVDMVDCRPMKPSSLHALAARCEWAPGKKVWVFGPHVRIVDPMPVKGRLGLYSVDDSKIFNATTGSLQRRRA